MIAADSTARAAPLLSIVVPVYNEEAVLPELHRRLTDVLGAQDDEYEVVLVDDGSTDGSHGRMTAIAAEDPHVRVVRLSRNFGHQIALAAGLDQARGQAVVTMDADLQDPPEVIPELVARWRDGLDVVYAVRSAREGETRFKKWTASGYYAVLGRMSDVDIPSQAGDFRLLSRRAVEAIQNMPERARFLRAMTSWVGFPQGSVEYERDARFAGTTKYPLRRMVKLATDGITSFSSAPLRIVSALGLISVVLALVGLVVVLYLRLFTEATIQGWTSLLVVVLLLGGIQLLSLGIVGQYVARIFDEVKRRPLYVLDEDDRDDAGPEAEPAEPDTLRDRVH